MTELGKKIAYGAVWMVLFKIGQRGLSIISTLVLVRLLTPADFGVMAMSLSVIALLDHLAAFKFDIVLIHNQAANEKHYNTAWTFNVLFGCASCALLLALSAPAADFFNEPKLEPVMSMLAFAPLIQGLENIGVVAFRKELRFQLEFRYLLAKKIIEFSVAIPLAFMLRNYWALVAGMLAGQLGATALSYVMHSHRPRFCIEVWRDLFRYSRWLVLNSGLGFLRLRSADFIIGRTAGTHALGLYNIALDISTLVTTQLSAPVHRAIFPGFAKLSADRDMFRKGYLSVLAALSLGMLPAATGIAAVADPFVRVVLGEPWVQAIPLIQILAVLGLISATSTNSLSVYLAVGKPWIITLLHAGSLLVVLPLAVYMSAKSGVVGAASAYLIVAVVFLPIDFSILFRTLGLRSADIASATWRPVAASGIMYLIVALYLEQLGATAPFASELFRLASSVLLGAAVYTGSIVLLWYLSSKPKGPEELIINRLLSVLKGLTPLRRAG